MKEAWATASGNCPTHSGVMAVATLRLAERMNGQIPEHARLFLANHADRILTEARELDVLLAERGLTSPIAGKLALIGGTLVLSGRDPKMLTDAVTPQAALPDKK